MITTALPYTIVGQAFQSEIRYDPENPFELTFIFHHPIHWDVSWMIGRDLVSEGMESKSWVGAGDISIIRQKPLEVSIRLRSGDNDGIATVHFAYKTLKAYLARTYQAVPAGSEGGRIDWNEMDEERSSW